MLRVLVRTFGLDYFRLGVILGALEVLLLKIGHPVLLWLLIRYFSVENDETYQEFNDWQIYIYATGIVIGSFSLVLHFHPNFFACRITSMRMRIALSSLIYRKVYNKPSKMEFLEFIMFSLLLLQCLKLDPADLCRITTGHVINLVANDSEFIENCSMFFPFLIIGPLVIIASAVLFIYFYGLVGLIGVGIFLSLIPIQSIQLK